MASNIPDKPALEGLEARWGERWSQAGTYRFDRTAAGRPSAGSGR
jgi:valyl-tRNA synthetase